MLDLAEMLGIECLVIDENTDLHQFKKDIKLNEVYYYIAKGIR
jgi:L-arabinose isomerase